MKNRATKKMLTAVLSGLAFSFTTINAEAVVIKGAPSCARMLKENDQRDRSWILGYISGIAGTSNKDFLRGVDNESIYLWVDNYCRANPLSILGEAVYELSEELIHKKRL